MAETTETPVTVFTGFLGAGKTTTILSMIKRLPPGYKVVLLKNEFGDIQVDSELAKEENIEVTEMMNGCLCCVLVGQMQNALVEIKEKFAPDRIVVEASGSAFPAPIAWQIRQMAPLGFKLDTIVTVIDCVNFKGYEDTSYTAKMQAKYTDLTLLNKHELVSESQLDSVLDGIYELNPDVPVLKCHGKQGVDPDLVFGIDSKLFSDLNQVNEAEQARLDLTDHQDREVDLLQVVKKSREPLSFEEVNQFLSSLKGETFYRIKGMVKTAEGFRLANFAFGRADWTLLSRYQSDNSVRLVFMGNGLSEKRRRIQEFFKATDDEVTFHSADHGHPH